MQLTGAGRPGGVRSSSAGVSRGGGAAAVRGGGQRACVPRPLRWRCVRVGVGVYDLVNALWRRCIRARLAGCSGVATLAEQFFR